MVAEQATVFLGDPCEVADAYRAGEARSLVRDVERSSLDGFVGRDRSSDGCIK